MSTPFPDYVPREVRRAWADVGYYPDRDLYALFAEHRHLHPDRQAVVDDDGALTYAELDDLVRRLASGLHDLGIAAGDVVGVQLSNGHLAVAVELALAALGAVALPYPIGRGDREAASLLRRSEAVAAIVASHYAEFPCAERTKALAGELPALKTVVAAGDPVPAGCVPLDELLRSQPCVPGRHDPDSPARILVSSGSEAEPKMVLYSHNALAGGRGRFMAQLRSQVPELRNLFLLPLGSAFGAHATPTAIAAHGGTLLLRSRFDAVETRDVIERRRPTHLFGVPTMLRMLLEHPARRNTDTTSLRAIVMGGAPLDNATARRASDLLGCSVINLYGSADGVNCHTDIDGVPSGDGVAGRPDPCAAEIRIVDDELGELPAGEVGEIIARGPMTPMCYVGAPELNQRYRTETGWVRTGDAGYLDGDGYLTVVGRRKDVIIRGGLNISPAQVEALLATHPAIADVACVPVSDPVFGERMCACVASQAELTLEDLTEHLAVEGLEQRKFPELLVLLPRLPLGPAGKVDRQTLRELGEKQAASQTAA